MNNSLKARATKIMMKNQYKRISDKVIRRRKESDECFERGGEEQELDKELLQAINEAVQSNANVIINESCPGNESGPMKAYEMGKSYEELLKLWEEENQWKEVTVPSRKSLVEAIPPEDEPLTEEEERVKVLLENFHLSPPQVQGEDDCLITRTMRQSKITEYYKPKK